MTAGLASPWVIVIELDDRLRVKSAAGGGGGGGGLEEEPPQPSHIKAREIRTASGTP